MTSSDDHADASPRDARAARLTACAASIPPLAASAAMACALVQLVQGLAQDEARPALALFVFPGLAMLLVVRNVIAVFQAPNRPAAWRRSVSLALAAVVSLYPMGLFTASFLQR